MLLFTEGKALVNLEFDSAPSDPIDTDIAKDIGRKQDAAIKKGLPSYGIVRCATGFFRIFPSGQATTWMGSPTFTLLKYHAALSGLRLMHPWLTLA